MALLMLASAVVEAYMMSPQGQDAVAAMGRH